MFSLKELLERSALDHNHLCPRQVLGVRIGMYAAKVLELAYQYVTTARSHWHAQLDAYQVIPDLELMFVQRVTLTVSPDEILSRPGLRVTCDLCKEEISNEREVHTNGQILCRSCAGQAYYDSRVSSRLEQNLLEFVSQFSCA